MTIKCGGFFVHTMKHCYATALYVTHARISLPHASVVYGRNAENEPYKKWPTTVRARKYGNDIA